MIDRRLAEAFFRWPLTRQDEDMWASEIVDDAVMRRPKEAWIMVLELLDHVPDEPRLAYLAAGPLEDLIVHHGDEMFDVIATESRNREKLRRALENVWVGRAPEHIQARFNALLVLPEP